MHLWQTNKQINKYEKDKTHMYKYGYTEEKELHH